MKERVLITDRLDPACADLLTASGFLADERVALSDPELREAARDAVGWIVRSGTTITKELMDAATALRVIGRAGVGVDNIDLEAATRRGVIVINAPEGNTISTAEHACALILALARRIPAAHASMSAGAWDRKHFVGRELFGKTLGVVGVGKVGRAVAERMAVFGMRVIGSDPVVSPEVAKESGVDLVTFEELLSEADIVTLHAPLTDATRGLFGADALSRCREGLLLVNCARGGLIDEAALLDALNRGRLAGVAMDVFAQEPPAPGFGALANHPHVICTPHIAASTAEAQQKVALQVTEQVVRGLRGETVSTTVNATAIRLAGRPEVYPFVELAVLLGRILAKLNGGEPITRVTVGGAGEIPRAAREVLSVAALSGVLGEVLDRRVNLVSAPVLAADAGLPVTEDWTSMADNYQHEVAVSLDTALGVRSIRGALFGRSEARIVGLDGYDLELRPEGVMLFYRNVDRPGMLAAVGAIVAEAGVNIGSMALGRRGQGGAALTVMHLDDLLPAQTLSAIEALDGLTDVCQVEVAVRPKGVI